MKTRVIFLLVVFTTIVTFVIGCKEEDPVETKGGITGTVTEEGSNKPIRAVEVTLSGISQTYKTGDDGKFEIKDLEEKDYTITVTKAGYITNKKQATVKANQITNLDFSLEQELPKLNVKPDLLDFGTDKEKLTFTIANDNPKTNLQWQVEKPTSASWLSLSKETGNLKAKDEVITVTVDRNKMTDAKTYTSALIVKAINGKGTKTINITAVKQGAGMKVEPSALNFGSNESEKTLLVTNSTKIGTINYIASANESWITITNKEGTITKSETGSIKVSVSRLNLAAGNHTGTVVVKSNKNTVTVTVSMEVLAKQKPAVTSLQASEIKHNAAGVSAYISSVGSAAVTAYGFCWGTNASPTTADTKNNLGGTSTKKSFNATITGLNPNTKYYVRAYATNEEGTVYSDAVAITTLAPPTMAVVRTFAVDNIKYNKAGGNGAIDNLGDGYVTAYGFCYSTSNPNPTLSDQSMSLGSTTQKGNFTGEITGLTEQTKYFVRAYATNSKGTAYGPAVNFTTPIAPPLVTSGLLAYYTFDNENCNDYFGNANYSGVLQGTGGAPSFVTDIPGTKGKALKTADGNKYYMLPTTPDKSSAGTTYSVWVKSKVGSGVVYMASNDQQWGRSITFYQNKAHLTTRIQNGKWYVNTGDNYKFSIDLSTILFDGNWHHLVITFNPKNNSEYAVAKLYVDSRFYQEISYYNYYRQSQARIGYKFTGTMDNLRVYNRALGQEEIKTIYNAKQ